MSNIKKYDDALFAINSVHPDDWKEETATFSDGELSIAGHPVMQAWEKPYMQELARIASSNGGAVLELGFGLGLSATYIQQQPIEKHIIIEANKDVFLKLEEFAVKAQQPVVPLFGLWEEVIPSLEDESIDGILFDTYITSFENADQFTYEYFPFFEHAYRILRKGGVFTYYSSEVTDFSPEHYQFLKDTGFSSIEKRVYPMEPPPDCLYWKKDTMIAPIIKK
jgi:guanidinoacetate N-methyltransferase